MQSPMKEVVVIGNNEPNNKNEQKSWKNSGNNGYLCSPQDNGGSDDSTGVLLDDLNVPRSTVVHFGPGSKTHTVLTDEGSNRLCGKYQTRFWIIASVILFIISIILAAIILQLTTQHCQSNSESERRKNICLSEECVRTAASLMTAMDHTADPCVDFFQFACGTWNKKHVIPEDKASISTFEVLADQLQVILKDVLEQPIDSLDSEATTKAKVFYKSCMDIHEMSKLGDRKLREVLKSLGGWPVATPGWKPPKSAIESLLGLVRKEYNEGILVEMWVGPDDKNSSVNIIQVDQMALTLPSRDYYLKANSQGDMEAYHRLMTRIAVLLGANSSTASAELEEVVEFEKKLANVSVSEADRHDTSSIYQQMSLKELQQAIPQLNWELYLKSILDVPFSGEEPIVSYALPYLTGMGKILAETDTRTVHNYVMWRLVYAIIPHMIDEYNRASVDFRRILQGILSERHRWSMCVEWTNKKFGMAVSALFIRDNFNHGSKEVALQMIHTIREAFNELLAHNQWMDDETRAVAKEKADAMNERIGYPDLLMQPEELNKEYTSLNISPDDFITNVFRVLKHEACKNLQLLRQPVNKDKWTTEPAIVNAFYNPNRNDIGAYKFVIIPAGILQPLFYSQHFPKSLNYGGIGVVIGHEITHGFDDKGRQFDKDGNMMQWWNNATVKAFRERAQCIIDQYSKYKIDEIGMNINGRMTQGENIADNGGLKQSFRAYRKWVSQHGPEPDLPGLNLTHDQLFFLNYAQIWCGSMRPEDALNKVRSSVHAPGPIRVLGPLSNSRDFSEAYHCSPGSPMNPVDKCDVW